MKSDASNILDLTFDELAGWCTSHSLQKFRAQQMFNALYRNGIQDFGAIKTLSQDHKKLLSESFEIRYPAIVNTISSSAEDTFKTVYSMSDGSLIESVLMCMEHKNSLCISTQVGCALNCRFCATGHLGFKRDLTAGEIIGQVAANAQFCREKQYPAITRIVFMGMGEPLLNTTELFRAISILTCQYGFAYHPSSLTVSTAGIIDGIEKMITSGLKVRLALSLNGYDDESRSSLMPVTRKYPLKKVVETVKKYADATGHVITLEYVVNSVSIGRPLEAAEKLARLLQKLPCKINLIPLNETNHFSDTAVSEKEMLFFGNCLKEQGFTVTIRRSKGADIQGACGQLAADSGKK